MYNYVVTEYNLYKVEYKILKINNNVIKIKLTHNVHNMLIAKKYKGDKFLVLYVSVIMYIKIQTFFIDKIRVLLRKKRKLKL